MERRLHIRRLLVAPALALLVLPVTASQAQNGPLINFIGVLKMNGALLTPSGSGVYQLPSGTGFTLVIEGRPGSPHPVGTSTLAADPSLFPDLQVQVDHPLGDGSPAVCDDLLGGVAAITTPSFADTQQNAAAINDFACRFVDGMDRKMGRSVGDACTFSPVTGDPQFMVASSTVQFCAEIVPLIAFHAGDTLVSIRLRDTSGAVSAVSQFIVEVGPTPSPTSTPPPGSTVSPTRTATATTSTQTPSNTPTVTRTQTLTSTSTAPPTNTPSRTATLTLTPSSTQHPTSTSTPTHSSPPTPSQTITPVPTQSRTNAPTASPTQTATTGPTGTHTATPTPSKTPSPATTTSVTPTISPTVPATPTSTRTPKPCVGDCSNTRTVAITDIITLVNIALGTTQSSACPNGVPSGVEVNVAVIIQAVNNALNGCPTNSGASSPPTLESPLR